MGDRKKLKNSKNLGLCELEISYEKKLCKFLKHFFPLRAPVYMTDKVCVKTKLLKSYLLPTVQHKITLHWNHFIYIVISIFFKCFVYK